MNRLLALEAALFIALALSASGCSGRITAASGQEDDTGPHPGLVEEETDGGSFKVDHPEQFPLATAGERVAAPELNVTGVVGPDVSRQVPVISTATGRVVEIDAKLGDVVQKGQLLFKVRSTDVSGAFSDYQKAIKNEHLARIQLERANLLFGGGAIAKSALEIAQNAEENAKVDVETTAEHLRLLGSDPDRPTGIVDVYSPVSGVITDQQITNAAAVQAFGPPNPFIISNLERVWIICDVYENDLQQVRPGEYADIHLNAYPGWPLKGKIGLIGAILDPNIHTAKVRLEVENAGILRLGMFVTATFHGLTQEKYSTVPAGAILHLHDRDWVYVPAEPGRFRRVEVSAGNMLPGNLQEVTSGIKPGERVVARALVFQQAVEQK
ncbi:MAG TPA: efflux RND transporter periplasmic adaptor subunit [Acidobacteriota bacterium]|nr:efflux RND transporter periplasmic adaptor subunit [Acidobacteriota bacterium]